MLLTTRGRLLPRSGLEINQCVQYLELHVYLQKLEKLFPSPRITASTPVRNCDRHLLASSSEAGHFPPDGAGSVLLSLLAVVCSDSVAIGTKKKITSRGYTRYYGGLRTRLSNVRSMEGIKSLPGQKFISQSLLRLHTVAKADNNECIGRTLTVGRGDGEGETQ